MGCTQNHQLIGNALDFIDLVAQVSSSVWSASLFFFYLPTLYHFLISKTKEAQGSSFNPTQLSTNQGNPGSGNYEDDIFAYAAPGPNLITKMIAALEWHLMFKNLLKVK